VTRCFLLKTTEVPSEISDFKTAFLNSKTNDDDLKIITDALNEEGNIIKGQYWILMHSLYGLRDAPHQWFITLVERLRQQGWDRIVEDSCVFARGDQFLLEYVDDMVDSGPLIEDAIFGLNIQLSTAPKSIKDGQQQLLGVDLVWNEGMSDLELSLETYLCKAYQPSVMNRSLSSPLPTSHLIYSGVTFDWSSQ